MTGSIDYVIKSWNSGPWCNMAA